jgi:hypothetical protein
MPHVVDPNCEQVFGTQQRFFTWSQESPSGHPHTCEPPQPSETTPHVPEGRAVQAVFVQHLFVSGSQTCEPVHPQAISPPQLLDTLPQLPALNELQPVAVQHLFVTGLHSVPPGQPPHSSVPPHWSGICPHAPGKSAHVLAEQHDLVPALHVLPAGQVPHDGVMPPHPSEYVPHVAPSDEHELVAQPHWPPGPPPPHDCGSSQPQKREPPQPSLNVPHWPPLQVIGVQHVLGVADVLQTCAPLQKLHVTLPPQPSLNVPPQPMPANASHVVGAHGAPQIPFALHTCPSGQVPQNTLVPQAVVAVPHWTFAWMQSSGVATGAHWLGDPPAPHSVPRAQVPQSSRPPQPSDATPHVAPSCAHVCLLHVLQVCES